MIDVCEKLAREAVVRYGGKVVTVDDTEVFKVPLKPVKMGELEQCWEPRDFIDDPKFTEAEMENITTEVVINQVATEVPVPKISR